ncbi:DASS family sodium-coupled anion symporter [Ghiorsea bivora]|uniref:DASS family sodium-coupled anion symporter n=1 Tax=Ghiorsea bivora TaxID=1485545 RepID=UPI00056E6686|nr:DASS family sodium-coupled anion symporter [Ghiorsea bivora]
MTDDLHPFSNPGRTKLSLVSRGLALPNGLPQASRWLAQTNGAETVLDLRLPSGHFCSVPVGQPYTEDSGFSLLSVDGNKAVLACGGEQEVVELIEAPAFYKQRTRKGSRMGSFASLHDKLLILQPFMGCGFFANKSDACAYCQYDSMLNEAEPPLRDPLELVEVVLAALAERDIDTVYLYNGFSPTADVGLSKLLPVIALLRRHLGHRQIALETVAPKDLSVIDALYAAGLDIFICNLEVFDATRFKEVCPGKAKQGGQDVILKALEYARRIFRPGTVVSHLIVGLEPVASTVDGMKVLVDKGIVPLLIPFRPLPNTPLEHQNISTLDDIEAALLEQYALLETSNIPSHRLRDMGRVLTPMESGVLDSSRTATLATRWSTSPLGRKVDGWLDGLRRHLRRKEEGRQTQPIHRLLFTEIAPFMALMALAIAFVWGVYSGAPEGLSTSAFYALLVFLLCLVLWVTQLLPLPITSLLGLALLPVLGVLPASAVFAFFGNPAVFFILGAFMLVAGVMQSGLSERLALLVLKKTGGSSKRLLMVMLFLPALMAFVMPEHAVAALFLPIAWEIVRALGLRKGHVYAQAIFFALAWGAIIGGVATLLGGARGPLALALLGELTGESFSFMQWSLAALPLVIGVLCVAAILLLRMVSRVKLDMQVVQDKFAERRLEMGVLTFKGWMMSFLMLGTVIAWLFAGHASALASIALVSVVLMFALRLVDWKQVETHVQWGVVLMYGGAIAIGKALSDTGAATWLAHTLIPGDMMGLALIALLVLITLLFTESVSNAAAVAIVLPIAMPVGAAVGIEPVVIALTIGIIAGFAFMLPMGTPPNAMIYASGYVNPIHMLKYGTILSLTALFMFLVVIKYWWPVIGFYY